MKPVNIKIYCDICKKEVIETMYEDSMTSQLSDEGYKDPYEEETKSWAEHQHWFNNHRRCAICGEVINDSDFSTMENDKTIKINQKYKEETLPREGNELLDIHKNCYHKSR